MTSSSQEGKQSSTTTAAATSSQVPAPAQATTSPSPRCSICNELGAKSCTSCKSTAYCGKKCQKIDWPCHKLLCTKLANSKADANRPLPDSIRTIFFPLDSDEPQFTYFSHTAGTEEGLEYEVSDLFRQHEDPAVLKRVERFERENEDSIMPRMLHCNVNKVRGYRDTASILEVWHLQFGSDDGHWSGINRCIPRVTGSLSSSAVTSHHWRGNVMVAAQTRREDHPQHRQVYKDMDLRDFRDAVDFLADYEKPQRYQDELAAALRWARDLSAEGKARGEEEDYVFDDYETWNGD